MAAERAVGACSGCGCGAWGDGVRPPCLLSGGSSVVAWLGC